MKTTSSGHARRPRENILRECTSSKKIMIKNRQGAVQLREVIRAGGILEGIYNIGANIWSVTSFNELRKEGLDCDRWNTMHPLETPRKSFVEQSLEKFEGPCVAATDYMKAYADQIREFVPNTYKVLGTDGYGRSDCRKLRNILK